MGSVLIDGIMLTPLKIIEHDQGNILHALKASGAGYVGFGEAYFSTINKDAIKGWKRHNQYTLNLIVPVGAIKFVVYDDRLGSRTKGLFFEITIGAIMNYVRLTIAPGLWLSFRGIEDNNLLLNIIAEEHDPSEADNVALESISYDWSKKGDKSKV